MCRDQRIELRLVLRQLAVEIEHDRRQTDLDALDVLELERLLLQRIEQRGVHTLDRRRRRPQPQRNLFEFPTLAEILGHFLRLAAIGEGIEQAAVLVSEEFAGGEEILLGKQCRHQARQRAAALMEFNRRRAPSGKGAAGLAAGKAKRACHRFGIEFDEFAGRSGRSKCAEHARTVIAARTERRVVRRNANAGRDFKTGGQSNQQVAARKTIALRDEQRGRYNFRCHMRERRTMDVAHCNSRDEIAVEHGRTGQRQFVATDHGAFR